MVDVYVSSSFLRPFGRDSIVSEQEPLRGRSGHRDAGHRGSRQERCQVQRRTEVRAAMLTASACSRLIDNRFYFAAAEVLA